MTQVCLLQVKSFGDLVIAVSAVERVAAPDRSRVSVAIGRHLASLWEALAPAVGAIDLDTRESGVPALFDVRKHGVRAALRSAFDLRRAIARVPIPSETLMLLDRVNLRERFILSHRHTAAIPEGAGNIYAGYAQLLSEAGLRLESPRSAPALPPPTTAGIFPGSRLAEKNLPADLVAGIMDELKARNIVPRLFLLDGERPDLEASDLPYERVPRQFTAMLEAVAASPVVISADSLPAHLAERRGAKTFVFTPRQNDFWMPPSVLRHARWSLFDDAERMVALRKLLETAAEADAFDQASALVR